ncbi:MAG TPA: PfkB family carbohydrate kinase [Ktedonobacterales bacterium]|nr:PfkB family carbohydrate kinase [Ktedonobacterales bacterium]
MSSGTDKHETLERATTVALPAAAEAAESWLSGAVAQADGGSPRARLLELVARFAQARVLVVGDMVADQYIIATPSRISREAPVLVLDQRQEFIVPGGATNPGVNARALGARVFLAGVVGDDVPGQRLRAALEQEGVDLRGVMTQPQRATNTKTRIVAGGTQIVQQQIVRVDRVDDAPPSADCARAIIAYVRQLVPQVDGLIISDYDSGVITPAIIEACLPLARAQGKIVVVDSHGDLTRFQGATALTPNEPEAAGSLGVRIADRASLEAAGRRLLEETRTQGVLITRGSEGMSLFQADQPPLHLPASNLTEVSDTTGAGDTVSATFTLALIAGATMAEAAVLSTIAAGLVVRRLGCATTTHDEMAAAITELVRA